MSNINPLLLNGPEVNIYMSHCSKGCATTAEWLIPNGYIAVCYLWSPCTFRPLLIIKPKTEKNECLVRSARQVLILFCFGFCKLESTKSNSQFLIQCGCDCCLENKWHGLSGIIHECLIAFLYFIH